MTQEEKHKENELLLKDISGRLPYGLIVQISLYRNDGIRTDIDLDPHVTENIWEMIDKYHALPYLRPLSSMTEEEAMEYANCGNIIANSPQNNYLIPNPNCVDWLNAHHFDYRGLIPMDLAIAVTEENNPYKQ